MNQKDLQVYRIIGKVQSVVSTSNTFSEAVKEGLKVILESKIADYAIIWFQPKEEGGIFAYYWICPFDFSTETRTIDSPIVGKTCQSMQRLCVNDLKPDDFIKKMVPDSTSVCCVPLTGSPEYHRGCVEFIKTTGSFNEEEQDICDLVTSLSQLIINEEAPTTEIEEDKEVILSVKNLQKSFKNGDVETKVLKGINLNVFKGEFLCLLGESGCGKSTLLNIIAGLLEADSGSVLFEGKELVGLKSDELTKYRRENIGFIFQQYNLMNNLSAKDNVKLIAELVKEPMDEIEALKLVKLDQKAHNYPSQLSGGQQQRISIARALVKKPKLIFADEPTAALDFETSIEVLEVLDAVLKSGATLVMVTHNEEIAKMANRVIRFKAGKVFETYYNRHPLTPKELEW